MHRCCWLLLLLNLAPASDAAAELPLPAEARWALCLDWTAARAAPALGAWIEQHLAGPEAAPKLAALSLITGFDLRRDLRRLWLAGSSTRPEEVVLVLDGTFDADRLVTLVRAADRYRLGAHRGVPVHAWFDANEQRMKHAAFLRPDRLVLANAEPALALAIDANLDGGAAQELGDWLRTSRGAVAAGAVLDMRSLEGVHPSAALLRQARSLRLRLDEADGNLRLRTSVTAADEAAATRLVDLVKGLQAAALLGVDGSANPVALELARTGQVQRRADLVEIEVSCPVTVLAERIAADAAAAATAAGTDGAGG
jgi:hypothetical protein